MSRIVAETRYIEGEKRYELAEMIGRGGFATVWRARSPRGGDVAVKVIPVYSAAERSRALREGQIAEDLKHPNIVETLEVIPGDYEVYLVTEYVRGTALDEAVEDYDMGEVVDALSQILEALVYAHEQGIIHRDIKPQNALVDARGTVKITDFGVAYRVGDTRLTQTGFAIGTTGYIAPEIMSGADPSELTDIYAVGATARTLLARQPDEPPPRLREFVERATSPNPAHRPQSAWEALKLLTGRRDPTRRTALRGRAAIPKGFSEQALRVTNGAIAGWLGYLGAGLLLNGAGAAGAAVGLGLLGYLLPRLGALGVIVALAVALARNGVGLDLETLAPAVGAAWVVTVGFASGGVARLPLGPVLAVPLVSVGLGAGLPLLFGALMRPLGAALSAAAGAVVLIGYELTLGDGLIPFLGFIGKLSVSLGPAGLAAEVQNLVRQVPEVPLLAVLWAAMAAVLALAEWFGRWVLGLALVVGGGTLGYALLVSASRDSLSQAMTSLSFAAIIYGLARYLGSRARG